MVQYHLSDLSYCLIGQGKVDLAVFQAGKHFSIIGNAFLSLFTMTEPFGMIEDLSEVRSQSWCLVLSYQVKVGQYETLHVCHFGRNPMIRLAVCHADNFSFTLAMRAQPHTYKNHYKPAGIVPAYVDIIIKPQRKWYMFVQCFYYPHAAFVKCHNRSIQMMASVTTQQLYIWQCDLKPWNRCPQKTFCDVCDCAQINLDLYMVRQVIHFYIS